jgi:hypothetical protein
VDRRRRRDWRGRNGALRLVVVTLRRALRLVADDGWRCNGGSVRRSRSLPTARRDRTTLDHGGADALLHGGLLLLLFDVALDALDDFGRNGTHVISDVGHADGLQ